MGLFGRKKKRKLTEKEKAQRKYAAQMRSVRRRAADQKGGSGPIAERDAAKRLRRKLGVKGPAKKKSSKKKSASRKKR